MSDLAKRAVACKHWRWMAGMLAKNSHNTVRVDAHVHGEPVIYSLCQFSGEREERSIREMPLPDLTDPATLGCLLALVREAYEDDGITTSCTRRDGETQWSVNRSRPVTGSTEIGPRLSREEIVLVAALEAAC